MIKVRINTILTCVVLCISISFGDIIIDNGQNGTSYTGTWYSSGGTTPYGTSSLWGRNGATYTWQFNSQPAGPYEVFMWWSGQASRPTSATVRITYNGGTQNLTVNQLQNAGKWNSLGTYNFGTSGSVTIVAANGSTLSTCADAVKWVPISVNSPPVASITSITPNPATAGQNVSFTGSGTDSDGTITAYEWKSDINGLIGNANSFTANTLSAGQHIISLRVQDDDGAWSPVVTSSLTVNPADIIIDNGNANCTHTGTWATLTGAGAYGTDSYWGRNGATYTWRVTPAVSGNYQVSAWWISYSASGTNIPVDIVNASGTNRVIVNQQLNGSKWNSLGIFPFQAGTTYNITITAAGGSSVYTCADAVKLTYNGPVNISLPPTAQILSITPNPAMPNKTITFTGKATDSDGTISAYSWRSSINGTFGSTRIANTTQLSAGTHTIYFKAQDNSGLWSPEVSATLDVGRENIYIAQCYGGNEVGNLSFTSVLQDLGARQTATNEWTYSNSGKTYYIHFVNTGSDLLTAMKRDGSHIIINAHSNYGLGPVFSTASENSSLMITNIRYADDDRFVKFGTPSGVGVSISGIRTSQAYPYWWPIYKDGKNAIAPYDFNDPNGPPVYNYYMTYQVPGDSNYYKVETVNKSAYQRFSECGKPAWYSATGAVPNPNNAADRTYFITNPAPWSPSVAISGTWTQYQDAPANRKNSQYFKENYLTNAAGTGNDYVRYLFTTPVAGQYKISAWWPALSTNASNAPFTIFYSGGNTVVRMNQTLNGRKWNSLGTYDFNVGNYSVLLTDAASSKNVVADGIKIGHINNPPDIVQANFTADVMSGPAPLEVNFDSISTGDLTDRTWNCGDGFTNTTRDSLSHTYTKAGTYNVSLTVTGPLGSSTKTKNAYITVLPSGSQYEPFKVEFDASSTNGQIPRNVKFEDLSMGLGDVNNVSWLWNFGDGKTSTLRDPNHVYTTAGNYTVSLTVTNASGASSTETKTNLVRAVVFEKIIDNVDYPKKHFGSKTIIKTKGVDITKDQLKFSKILYESCNSGDYYIQTLGHGRMFYTTATASGSGALVYLRMYLQGRTDQDIWSAMQQAEACYDYYNFDLPPGTSQLQQTTMSTSLSMPQAFTLSNNQKEEINAIKKMSTTNAFNRLSDDHFIANSQLSEKAISEVFKNSQAAVDFALNILPALTQTNDHKSVNMLITAKRILVQFADQSIPKLLLLDNPINKNIIIAAGPLSYDPSIRKMLVAALDEKAEVIDDSPDLVGQPLRICDIAYNQLVLNLKITNLLRTIGTSMDYETRDYHINLLKQRL